MEDRSYKKSFILAVIINILLVLALAFSKEYLPDFNTKKPEKISVLEIDMDKYEVQGDDPTKKKGLPGDGTISDEKDAKSAGFGNSPSATGNNGEVDKTIKSERIGNNGRDETALTNTTPYAGGYEIAKVGVKDVMTQGQLRAGNAQKAFGKGKSNNGEISDAPGGGNGIGNGTGGGNGYVDLSGYMAKLNQLKSYPQRARRRGIEGKVVYKVYFSAQGDVIKIELISSSGSAILDNAGKKLIKSGGRIFNTTKKETVEIIPIAYELVD